MNTKLLLLLMGIHLTLFSQENEIPRRVQFGFYSGVGGSNHGKSNRPGVAYEVGQSTIISQKKRPGRRLELYFQFVHNNHQGDSRIIFPNSYKTDSTYALSHFKSEFLHAGLKWHIPIIHKDKYRLLIAPGFLIGSLVTYKYTRRWYYFADNSLQTERENGIYPTVRVVIGPTIAIKQEFRLHTNLYFHVDVNWLSQGILELDGRGIWSEITLRSGLYWYLKPYKSNSK